MGQVTLSFLEKEEKYIFDKFAKQCSGSVYLQSGNNVVLATIAIDTQEVIEEDFLPLTVQYIEKAYAAGKFPGGYIKREAKPGGFSISVDTARVWYEDSYTIGSGSGAAPGSTMETAFSVSQAKENIDAKDVWVCGYIVGGDMTSSKTGISFEPPFTSATNIAIASRSSVSDKSSCLSVKLVSGEIRNALNLVDNPSLLGRKVYLKGDLVSAYYGIPGIQNISEYSF